MRNLHKLEHLPMYISKWGSLNHLDTGTFESFHKVGTTAIWEKTSKRHNTLFQEMTRQINVYDYHRLTTIKNDILADKMVEKVIVDKVIFRRIANLPKYDLFVPYGYSERIYVGVPGADEGISDKDWSNVCSQRALNSLVHLSKFLQTYMIHEVIQTHYKVRCDKTFNQIFEMHIIQGVSYSSDEESQMGNGTIYACARHNIRDRRSDPNKPRYDYVFIKYDCILEPVLVRILMFVEINRLQRTTVENENMIVLLVQKLIKVPKTECLLGDTYQFAGDPENKALFNFDIVPVQSIIRPAFVVPIFSKEYNPVFHKGSDRFRVLDRMFFDRSGWQSFDRLNDGLDTIAQRESYIAENQTSSRIFPKNTVTDVEVGVPMMNPQDNNNDMILAGGEDDDTIYDSDNENY